MTAHTYTSLKDAIFAYTEDASDEFIANISTIINNGQERLVRDLDLEIFKGEFAGSITAGANYINKPTDLLAVSSLYTLDATDQLTPLKPRTYDWCVMYAGGLAVIGTPKYYAEGFSATQILVVKSPAVTTNYVIRGIKRPIPISDTLASNWLSVHAGDILLYACLVESEGFLMASQTGRVQEWESEYLKRIPQARQELGTIARTEYTPQQPNDEAR